MADLKQALIWLAEGKKIRRSTWPNIKEYRFLYNCMICSTDDLDKGALLWFDEDDWELYEEPKQDVYTPHVIEIDKKLAELEKRIANCENHLCLKRYGS